jgi:hypothetical protein
MLTDRSWTRGDPQCLQDGSVQTRTQVHQHLGECLAGHLPLDNDLMQLLKGLCDEVLFVLHVTCSLSVWMLMKPVQDGPFQALLERCPGLPIAVRTRTAQELQARSLECLADILSHVVLLLVFAFERS